MSAANSSPRGIDPRRRWQHERDWAFDEAVDRVESHLLVCVAALVCFVVLVVPFVERCLR